MRKIREVLRLRLEADLSVRQISICTKVSVGSIQKLLKKVPRRSALPGPYLPSLMMADWLPCSIRRPIPPSRPAMLCRDWPSVHQELQAQGVSKQLLWEEYTQRYPNSCYSYSQFCDRYKSWCQLQKRSMRQIHKAGKSSLSTTAGPRCPSCRRLRVRSVRHKSCRRARCVQPHLC